jgi:hypothetical protein
MTRNVARTSYFGNTEMVRPNDTTGNSRMAAMCELPTAQGKN